MSSLTPSMTFSERLWPGPALWVSAGLLAGVVGLIMLPISTAAVAIGALVTLLATAGALIASTPTVAYDGQVLVAGRAKIEAQHLGQARIVSGADLKDQVGPGLNALAYLCFRSWVPDAVRIEILDSNDPTPYWLVSSRRPHELIAALSQAS